MKKITLRTLVNLSVLAVLSSILAIFINYYRYRFVPLNSVGQIEDIVINDLEIYANKLSYKLGDSIFIAVKSNQNGKGILYHNSAHHIIIPKDSFTFNLQEYSFNKTESEKGCHWAISDTIIINDSFPSGYYTLIAKTENDTSRFNFIIEQRKKTKIAVLAPVSTWVAYNNWGGKSLYMNNLEEKTTYFVSTKRPNPNQDIRVETNSTQYFLDQHGAVLLPDFALEYDMNLLKQVDIIVLNHHAEYFTETMYDNLVHLLKKENISLISLGGNQMYWKTQWNSDYTVMECRKDLTSFSNSIFDYGGMWRHHINKSEHNVLGVQFTDEGMHSYAPYQVKNQDHWIYEGTDVKNDDLFGKRGIDSLPLSGDETDKIITNNKNITLLAKGLNCSKKNPYNQYDNNCYGNPGADFIIKTEDNYSVLSTGSIQSGSGLGNDKILTQMIENFIYHETNKPH